MDTTVSPEPAAGTLVLRDFRFAEGGALPELRLRYTTLGTLRRDSAGRATNAVLLLHGTGAADRPFCARNSPASCSGRASSSTPGATS